MQRLSVILLILHPPEGHLWKTLAQRDREVEGSGIMSPRFSSYNGEQRLAVQLRRINRGGIIPKDVFARQVRLKLCQKLLVRSWHPVPRFVERAIRDLDDLLPDIPTNETICLDGVVKTLSRIVMVVSRAHVAEIVSTHSTQHVCRCTVD